MPFRNRDEAAEQLADALSAYAGRDPLVLAIPRGAVPMGRIIADRLDGELDVVLVSKIGAPGNPEFAIGAVSEDGDVHLTEAARRYEIDQEYIDAEVEKEVAELRARRERYTPVRAPIDPEGRVCIVVDDGIATGSTMEAAIRALRGQGAEAVVAAVAVAPPETAERMRAEVDELVALETPAEFYAVGQFFREFGQVTNDEVERHLRRSDRTPR